MKSIKMYILILIAVLGLNASCKKLGLCEDDNLSIVRKDYLGDELRIDGFFIEYQQDSSEEYTNLKFFYQNGVELGFLDYNNKANNSGDLDIDKIDNSLKSIGAWGVYNISGKKIEIERYRITINGCRKTTYQEGEIQNDTTFIINRIEYRDGGKIESVETPNSTFYFRPLDTKPDSTNSFIK
jgi:hypothetical protein